MVARMARPDANSVAPDGACEASEARPRLSRTPGAVASHLGLSDGSPKRFTAGPSARTRARVHGGLDRIQRGVTADNAPALVCGRSWNCRSGGQ